VTGPEEARRRFLGFLAGSPLLASAGAGALAEDLITAPDQALNVFDFEPVARKLVPPAHFGYLQTGVDDEATLRANRQGFDRYALRVRRLIDVSKVDMSVSLFGTAWDSPIVLAPVSSHKAFHAEGEPAVARAARAKKHLMVLSTVTTTSVEDVTAARGAPIWFQLYPTDQWPIGKAMVQRAEKAGCPALVLTVDLQGGSNRETAARARRQDTRQCSACHVDGFFTRASARIGGKPMFAGLDVSGVRLLQPLDMTWDYLKRLRDATSMRLLVKGIVTREDAEQCVAHGADGVIVSNHGGRAEDSGRSTIESLPEVVEGVRGRVPVLVDSGFRRGTDVFKALALGASAVCIGRPYMWGLAAFGQPGVEAVLEILRRELTMVMRQAGTLRVADIGRAHVVAR
jgi:isopentenyl diphosphate isomerase/L-lactate dehydrogenase-like FMN-dependent dehydrogenase